MKTYIANIIPNIQRFNKQLDEFTLLTNQRWISLGDLDNIKRVYTFDKSGTIDIYENGIEVDSGTWRFYGDALKLKLKNSGYLLKNGFLDENIIALKLDGTDGYAFFVNENKYNIEIKSLLDILNFLKSKYLSDHDGYISEDQQEWIENPDKCPACGCSDVTNKNICPNCEINLV